MKNTDLHTHNIMCGHAEERIEAYVKAAIEKDITRLGISDHIPFPDNRLKFYPGSNSNFQIRMDYSELPDYFKEYFEIKNKYSNKIKLNLGLEAEYYKEFDEYYDYLLETCDYLIGSVHNIYYNHNNLFFYGENVKLDHFKLYRDKMIELIESKIFSFVAHPDLFFTSYYGEFDYKIEDICIEIAKSAKSFNIPLEINVSGYRKNSIIEDSGTERFIYPFEPFWEVASRYDCQVIINSDSHKPLDVGRLFDKGYDLADKYNLKEVKSLPFFD